ncbi:hypothetical protein ACFT8P_13650 [Streptomyces sp. NPDC057101]|uniref:hypothetical protein n=1 Tax=Streptomyces sp. NPDC057101 TaxID=3346020 RepID=UPI00364209C0
MLDRRSRAREDEIGKGYEVSKDHVIPITDQDLADMPIESVVQIDTGRSAPAAVGVGLRRVLMPGCGATFPLPRTRRHREGCQEGGRGGGAAQGRCEEGSAAAAHAAEQNWSGTLGPALVWSARNSARGDLLDAAVG